MLSRLSRMKGDLKYMILNHFVNSIPAWWLRKFLYKIMGLKIGKNSRIGIKTIILSPKQIKIGNNTIINEWCYLDGRGGLEIGDNTSLSIRTTIITATHNANHNFDYILDKTIIKNHVWTGVNATILNGSVIEDFCVIGAGSVIKGTTEQKAIYIGNPANKIKDRETDEYQINYKPFFR